jgi:type IV secretion system protein VirB9
MPQEPRLRLHKQTATAITDYQASYPRKLFFGYTWDAAKAERLGLQAIWSDDKFTYIRGDRVLALYEVNEDGKPSLIQYSYDKGLYTVPKLLYDGYLAIGTQKKNVVTFHRDRGNKS